LTSRHLGDEDSFDDLHRRRVGNGPEEHLSFPLQTDIPYQIQSRLDEGRDGKKLSGDAAKRDRLYDAGAHQLRRRLETLRQQGQEPRTIGARAGEAQLDLDARRRVTGNDLELRPGTNLQSQ